MKISTFREKECFPNMPKKFKQQFVQKWAIIF